MKSTEKDKTARDQLLAILATTCKLIFRGLLVVTRILPVCTSKYGAYDMYDNNIIIIHISCAVNPMACFKHTIGCILQGNTSMTCLIPENNDDIYRSLNLSWFTFPFLISTQSLYTIVNGFSLRVVFLASLSSSLSSAASSMFLEEQKVTVVLRIVSGLS